MLPEGIYLVKINDVNLKTRARFKNPDETEDVFSFEFGVLDPEYLDRKLWKNVTPSLFAGTEGLSPSGLYELIRVTSKPLTPAECEAGIGGEQINKMIGKELNLVVKVKSFPDGSQRNIIDSVVKAKNAPVSAEFDGQPDYNQEEKDDSQEEIDIDNIPI